MMKRGLAGSVSILALSLWMLLSGCETSLDLPSYNLPKLTIISHVAPGGWERQRVFVYVSQSPSDVSHFYTPAHLEVEVTESESQSIIRLDSVREGNKVFFPFPEGFLKAGFSYSISASAPGFKTVHANTVIPQPSTIANLRIQDIRTHPSDKHDFKTIVRYKLVFDIDHFESNRYYHLVFYNEYAGIDELFIVNPEESDIQPYQYHYAYGILLDKEDMIQGEPLAFNFVDWVLADNDLIRVHVELRTITEAYYKYHSSLARQVNVRQDPFAEPVAIYNNIEGGYGNFSGFSPNVSSSDLPK